MIQLLTLDQDLHICSADNEEEGAESKIKEAKTCFPLIFASAPLLPYLHHVHVQYMYVSVVNLLYHSQEQGSWLSL